MKRSGSAVWQGDLKNGKGMVSTDSGVLSNQQYSFGTRFENGQGTNPEELIAAAHAGCFTMALSAQLGNAGLTPEKLETKATVTLDKLDAGWAVTHIHLDVKGRVPKADQAAWEKATQAAKTGCPISKRRQATIEMHAKLEG
jgi:lipoyl-dependent peroxiredoxin